MKIATSCKLDRKIKIDGHRSSDGKLIEIMTKINHHIDNETVLYSREHAWVRMEDSQAIVGICDHVQHQLGRLLLVELPDLGEHINQRAIFGMAISLKSSFELYMPISGKVVAVNTALENAPEQVNIQPYSRGWMIRIEPDDPSELKHLLSDNVHRTLHCVS